MPKTTQQTTPRKKSARKVAKRRTAKKTRKKLAKKAGRQKCAAILTVRNAPNFSPQGAKDIAKWLRKQAKFLEHHYGVLAKSFNARYLYS